MPTSLQIHDSFFKSSLTQKKIAVDFFKAHIPKSLQKHIDYTSLRLSNKSFVTEKYKQLHSDLVYQCKINQSSGYLYLLIEHQTTADKLMAFRKQRYLFELMDEHLNQGNKKLPIVIPMCLYHGKESPYPYSTDIFDCFDEVCLAKQLMFKPFNLIDLTVISDEEIVAHGLSGLMEILFKNYRAKNFFKVYQKLIEQKILQKTICKIGENYLQSVLTYIINVSDKKHFGNAENFIDETLKALPDERQQIMTLVDELRLQGMQQGIEEGILKGREETVFAIARKMLVLGQDIQMICEITGLTTKELASLVQ